MICKTCFHEIDDNVTTCPYCGTAMGDEDENAPTKHDNFEYPAYSGKESENVQEYNDENYDEDYDDEPYESSGKRLIFVIAGIIAGFVVFGCVLMAVLHFADGSTGKTTTTEPPSTTEEAVSTTLEEPSTEEATTEEPTTLPPTTQYDENGMPLGYDLIWRGTEITTGAQREHRYEILKQQAEEKGLAEDVKFYLEFFRYGCPPHGGFGLGVVVEPEHENRLFPLT